MIAHTKLGTSGIEVSRLCFGSLTVSALGAGLPVEEGAHVICHALERGINFIDTAQYYENYDVIRLGTKLYLQNNPTAAPPVICSKTYAYNRDLAKEAVDEARRALDRDVIDIFMLHEQESIHTLRGHMEALEYLYECRDKGIIRAVGISAHCVDAITAASEIKHTHGEGLDVVFPMYNRDGLGIIPPKDAAPTDADSRTESIIKPLTESEKRLQARAQMYSAMKRCHDRGIGVMLMKIFGGGHLLGAPKESADTTPDAAPPDKTADGLTPSDRAAQAMSFALACDAADCIAVGMQSESEVDANIAFLESGRFPDSFKKEADTRHRRLVVEDYCEGCGRCVARCGQGAMRLSEGAAVCDAEKCVLCGYCAGVCPHFAIKVI